MNDPDGYKAPIHLALTRVFTLGGVPRQWIMAWFMFCFGAGLLCQSWGAVALYILGHAVMAYATWREPYWPAIAKEAITFRLKLRHHRIHLVRDERPRSWHDVFRR